MNNAIVLHDQNLEIPTAKKLLRDLRKEVRKAINQVPPAEIIVVDGQKVIVSYAKYLIEYLAGQLEKH